MNNTTNYRIFVEKLPRFRVEAESLRRELNTNLNLSLGEVRLLCVYDLFGFSEELLEKSRYTVFGEVMTDSVTDTFDLAGRKYIAVEYLPGQFDQRAASAVDCVRLIDPEARVDIRSSRLLVFDDKTTDGELAKIRHYYINAVESREKDLSVLSDMEQAEVKPVGVLEGFREMADSELEPYCKTMGLAMNADDLREVVKYFRSEGRDPYETELRILDTYWSDHCRHTTFTTELEGITVEESFVKEEIEDSLALYLRIRRELGREHKSLCLMDMATIGARYLRQKGLLDDLEVSEENNACSVYIDVDVDGRTEKWLLQFKNETHNHPTEIEPFGGASTCLGGAIRDPLSGRSYVYQAMRVTGAGNIYLPVSETLSGKLPQSVISKKAAAGYSSYGNQIGLATTHVREIYHDDYVAKRLEVGAVVGAVKAANVRRERPAPGDKIIMFGGRTGRDGIGGATGSSKEHDAKSLETCGSEVQKGNAPEERKLERLFRRPEVTRLVKKSNDFGAGGVSVAIGELADGLDIYLDRVKTKYSGLNSTELAISESQERMSVVVEAKDMEEFMGYCREENIEAVHVADVTDTARMRMFNGDRKVVDLKREFIDSAGAKHYAEARIGAVENRDPFPREVAGETLAERFTNNLKDNNVVSQRGLVEMFDATIGRSTVLMPFGGRMQRSETQVSVQKLPTDGYTDTAQLKENFAFVSGRIESGKILSAWSVGFGGVGEGLAKMAFGNGVGAEVTMDEPKLYEYAYGSILVECEGTLEYPHAELLGFTVAEEALTVNGVKMPLEELYKANTEKFAAVYPDKGRNSAEVMTSAPAPKTFVYPGEAVETPVVYIPVFPGTNCDYDTAKAFRAAGAEVRTSVLCNIAGDDVLRSIAEMKEHIRRAHIFVLAGGFSAGDEPDGSAKFIVNVLNNKDIRDEIHALTDRGGLILGICNGFQALVKSGLLPYGRLGMVTKESPTLFRNDVNRHISQIVSTRVATTASPWLRGFRPGELHSIAVSHGEGKFVVSEELARELFANGQVAFQYADAAGNPTAEAPWNPNGSSYAIEGIISQNGLILGKMGHTERYENNLFKNIAGNKQQSLFANAVAYFRKVQ